MAFTLAKLAFAQIIGFQWSRRAVIIVGGLLLIIIPFLLARAWIGRLQSEAITAYEVEAFEHAENLNQAARRYSYDLDAEIKRHGGVGDWYVNELQLGPKAFPFASIGPKAADPGNVPPCSCADGSGNQLYERAP